MGGGGETGIKAPLQGQSVADAESVLRTQIAMACMILGIIFFGILLGSIAEAFAGVVCLLRGPI